MSFATSSRGTSESGPDSRNGSYLAVGALQALMQLLNVFPQAFSVSATPSRQSSLHEKATIWAWSMHLSRFVAWAGSGYRLWHTVRAAARSSPHFDLQAPRVSRGTFTHSSKFALHVSAHGWSI